MESGKLSPASGRRLKAVVLVGSDSVSTRLSIGKLLAVPEIQCVAILHDIGSPSWRRRLRNFRRNTIRDLLTRVLGKACEFLNPLCNDPGGEQEVLDTLRRAFPRQAFCLDDFTERHGIPVLRVKNLNSGAAVSVMAKLAPDIGIVLGTRVLRERIFSVPRMGCVNLHKGKVPEYRGMPPGFWELYEGATSAGVTVHQVDSGVDTGAVLAEGSIPIHEKDTSETLRRKLDVLGSDLLARAVADLARGKIVPQPQPPSQRPAHRNPTPSHRAQLRRRRGGPAEESFIELVKSVYLLAVYYSGLFRLVRWVRARSSGPVPIILYHRVNDDVQDAVTTDVRSFAAQMVALRRYGYTVITTDELVTYLERRQPLPPRAALVHFDDCYRDVYTTAAPILSTLSYPACIFVNSGFVGTDRRFQHDIRKCPVMMQNLSNEELRDMSASGFEIGAHTVNHVDLGSVPPDIGLQEAADSKRQLEMMIGRRVDFFAYPFGGKKNIRSELRPRVLESGFRAIFSAYGGFVTAEAPLDDVRRLGISGAHRVLDMLLEIEGISLRSLWRRVTFREVGVYDE